MFLPQNYSSPALSSAGVARRPESPVPDRSTPVEVWALADVVNRLRRILRSSIRSEFPWERLPMAQVEILQRLAEEPGLRVTELAARQKLAINTVSNVLQQMVLAGLVDRRVDQHDRRAVTVHLTDTGAAATAGLAASQRPPTGRRVQRPGREGPHRDPRDPAVAEPARRTPGGYRTPRRTGRVGTVG